MLFRLRKSLYRVIYSFMSKEIFERKKKKKSATPENRKKIDHLARDFFLLINVDYFLTCS